MKAVIALLLYLAAFFSTALAVTSWYDHDDHASIGFIFLTNALMVAAGLFSASARKVGR